MEDVKDTQNTENISDAVNVNDEETGMGDLLRPEVTLEEGKVITVTVVGETKDGFLVDLGLKSEGIIPREEAKYVADPSLLMPGAELQVMLVKLRTQDGHPLVSHRQAHELGAWDKIQEAFKSNVVIDGTIRKKVKGGFMVDIGLEAFLPMSQLELRTVKDPTAYLGQTLQFVITEVNRGQKNVVVSRRKLLEVSQKELRDKTIANIFEGQIIEGTVTGITDFGAFVNIGGIEGLLHIGDLAWYHVKKVEDVLQPDQKVNVKVLKIDKEKGKVSLGLKQLSAKPWESAAEKYPAGTIVKGTVTSVTDFGVFVKIEPGLEGLLHFSEVSWNEHEAAVRKNFKTGQELELKVISIDPVKEKMSLSLKRRESNPWEEVQKKYPSGSHLKGTITHLTPFGAFVKLPEGIEGLIHVADMSWSKKVRHPQEVVQVGQEIEAVVLDVNPQNEKIGLSLKHLGEDPFRKYRTGAVVTGVVKRFVDFGAFVELEPGIEALVRMSEIGPKKPENITDVLALEQTIEAKVIKSDVQERKIDISIRKLDQERERELLAKYVNKDEKPTLGQLLEEEE